MATTYRICVSGRVQGVGFRPHVCVLASRMGLRGEVFNDRNGVLIYLEGEKGTIRQFYDRLLSDPPPLARITAHRLEPVASRTYADFKIGKSDRKGNPNLPLTPDFGICQACADEMLDPANRRYHYPFISCVNCGPRWSITRRFPFERDHTSMEAFPMCETCNKEYSDPSGRRFHSQTNSCPDCGIQPVFYDNDFRKIPADPKGVMQQAADAITAGKIVAVKNNAGYLLCCDATNTGAVMRLRKRKKRPAKPFALLYPGLEQLTNHLQPSLAERDLLASVERPIVIIAFKEPPEGLATEAIAPGLQQLGVMLPSSGILELLASFLDNPVVATSGNLHGSPVLATRAAAREQLSSVADCFVEHDLKILNPQDDSVLRVCPGSGRVIYLRRSRGLAPNIRNGSGTTGHPLLATGSQLKSTVALMPNDHIYVSQYLGNLDNYDVYRRFTGTTRSMLELFGQKPEAVLSDLHPGYAGSRFGKELADELDVPQLMIQHHRAHFASVLGEHELFDGREPVLGVIWDGTGYGDDGHIWGGEFFSWQQGRMKRVAHLDYFHWLGGDKMAREPRLSLLALMDDHPEVAQKFDAEAYGVYRSLKRTNKLMTSSVGRLFDAVASLLGLCDLNSYEGQAAMLLERLVDSARTDAYRAYHAPGSSGMLDPAALIARIGEDIQRGTAKGQIAGNFLFTLAKSIFHLAASMGMRNICFSGGVFQNAVLIDMLERLGGAPYNLYFHTELSPNDENISHGQLMYYLHCLKRNEP